MLVTKELSSDFIKSRSVYLSFSFFQGLIYAQTIVKDEIILKLKCDF